jgi:hypothetical protein
MIDNNNDSVIEIFSGTLWECQMITSMLQDVEIETYLVNSVFSTYAFNPLIAENTKVVVSSNDRIKAQMVIDEYYHNLKNDNHS